MKWPDKARSKPHNMSKYFWMEEILRGKAHNHARARRAAV